MKSNSMEIKLTCIIYKSTQGMNFLIFYELFTMGKSIMSIVLHEVVFTINRMVKDFISWPCGDEMQVVIVCFKDRGGLFSMQGAINKTHISMQLNPLGPFHLDYYHHKTCGYNIVAHVVIDCNKYFTNLFIGLPNNVNDYRVLKRSTLYKCAHYHDLFKHTKSSCVLPLYFFRDKEYLLIYQIMTPSKEEG